MTSNLQIWAPLFELSVYDRSFSIDLENAQSQWLGEERIWLLPDAPRVHRWQSGASVECMVPAADFNVIDVFHLNPRRQIYPLISSSRTWRRGLPGSLYAEWARANPRLIKKGYGQVFKYPVIKGNDVSYEDREFRLGPGTLLPQLGRAPEAGGALVSWPPPGGLPTVSPEAESEDFYGRAHFEFDSEGKHTGFVVTDKGHRLVGTSFRTKWPEPLETLFQTGGGADVLYHHALMRHYIEKLGEGRHEEVLKKVEILVGRFTIEASSSMMSAYFLPQYAAAESEESLKYLRYQVAELFGIESGSIDDLKASPKFSELMTETTSVLRVFGWVGYFWWEFFQELKSHRTVRMCKRCGNVVVGGHRDRKYCRKSENPDCFRQGNAEAQRRSRSMK